MDKNKENIVENNNADSMENVLSNVPVNVDEMDDIIEKESKIYFKATVNLYVYLLLIAVLFAVSIVFAFRGMYILSGISASCQIFIYFKEVKKCLHERIQSKASVSVARFLKESYKNKFV